eukprot:Plantae.Rhodophyta-Hildenbrandia_rubra.ctg13782.p1 GENE.Plantae.Rhodophyta-Hildenbrandia_rubra.ctg13782~~Plantae.Rhodophyta-Hildenbrandia_rubra.ctg13782.p1  ORF type:complete len:631 (+),score=195.30 Plantae.Rhodophyta-Hildenbrandia_rubra.ctg13782:40-1893(+)
MSSKKCPRPATPTEPLRINKTFATNYAVKKRRELISNNPQEDVDIQTSSSSEDEDEYAELLTRKVDGKIREVIQAVRNGDKRVYDSGVKFFEEEEGEEGADETDGEEDEDEDVDEPLVGWEFIEKEETRKKTDIKMRIGDYVRERLLDDGKLSEDEEEDGYGGEGGKKNGGSKGPMDKDVGKVLKFKDDDDAAEDEDDDAFFKKKKKSTYDLELGSKMDGLPDLSERKKSRYASSKADLHAHLMAPEDEKERFLQEFVLNNGWLEGNEESAPVAFKAGDENKDVDLSVDEEELDEADAFETKYNFRFEDGAAQGIATHARDVKGSLRRADDRRKQARKAREERKKSEKMEKAEEIKRLKNEKRKEIVARLTAIEEAAGENLGFEEMDLEQDFDPDKFTEAMEKKFNEEYYERPDEPIENEKESGKSSTITANRGDNEEVTEEVKTMMDEYYQLDYEDIIGGEPVRFRYKGVDAEDFKMTPNEILAAEDKELNRQVSLKYIAPYRTRKEIPKQVFNKSRRRWLARQKEKDEAEPDAYEKSSEKLRKREKTKKGVLKDGAVRQHDPADVKHKSSQSALHGDAKGSSESKKRKRKKKKTKDKDENEPQLSKARREAYGLV